MGVDRSQHGGPRHRELIELQRRAGELDEPRESYAEGPTATKKG